MKTLTAVCILLLCSIPAFPQASGNFSASSIGAACAIGAGGSFSGGTGLTLLSSRISTSSGSGVVLNIRPSLVTGLFTKSKIDTSVSTASADVGIQVCVTLDGSPEGVQPRSCVVYDQRFQMISSQLFSQLTACTAAPTTTACTWDTDCGSLGTGFTCNIAAGATTGMCIGPNASCNFELLTSTLSAHSFDFIVRADNKKTHLIEAKWSVIGSGISGASSIASCVGPGILTVTQEKVFNNSGSLLTF